jgi:iron complex outermembrane receptor protein
LLSTPRAGALVALALFAAAASAASGAGGGQAAALESTATLIVAVREGAAPVAGALVEIGTTALRTDAAGQAIFRVWPGRHSVSVSADGFRAAKATADTSAGATTRLEIQLQAAVTASEELVVTAARSDRRIQDQPLRVEVVDREDIEEKALMTPGSVAMLLGETTGLRVQTTAPSFGGANVRIQGLRGRYSLLLSDGLPLYGSQGDSLSLMQVPPLDLGQVEIIKGAASALYGPSALGGVIDLVSQRPAERERALLANVTTQEAADLTAFLVQPARGAWAYTVLAGIHAQARRDLDGDGWSDLPGYARGVARPRLFWSGGKGSSVFATAGAIVENRRGGSEPGRSAPDGRPFAQDLDSRRYDSGSVAHFVVGAKRVLSARASFSYNGDDRAFGEARERGRRTTGFGEAVLRGTAETHVWLVGVAAQRDSFASRELAALEYVFTTAGVFAQDEVHLGRTVTLGASGRLDRHDRYGTFASPRLSLLFRPAEPWTLRASAGTGFFAPSPFLEETEEAGLARVQPLREVAAERARSGSLDLGWRGGRIDVNATLFASRVEEPVRLRQVADRRFAVVNAREPVRTWGGELLARYRAPGLMLLLTHSYTRSTEQDLGSGGRREVPLTPRHVLTANAIWEGDWGRLGLEGYYTGRQPLEDDPYREQGRGYFLFGALGERRFGRARVFVNLENIGNVRQTRFAPLLRPARANDGRWTVDAWAPLDGFVANGGVRLEF